MYLDGEQMLICEGMCFTNSSCSETRCDNDHYRRFLTDPLPLLHFQVSLAYHWGHSTILFATV